MRKRLSRIQREQMIPLDEARFEPIEGQSMTRGSQRPFVAADSEGMQTIFESLTEVEKKVLLARFPLEGSEPLKLEEIGKQLGLSKSRVGQIQEKALEKARAHILAKGLTFEDFLHQRSKISPVWTTGE